MTNPAEPSSASYVGHELRTLFALIMANIDIIEMEHGKSEWIDDIREECKRSNQLIEMLMGATNENASPSETFDVTAQVHRMIHFFKPLGKEKHLMLLTDVQENVTSHHDRSEMVQVFSVLFGNAIKYCDESGLMRVALQREGEGFRFVIQNSYSEAKSSDVSRFFEEYYRAPHPDEPSKGYGIGLTIAHKIVAEQGGSLEAMADEENNTITFVLAM